jgi:methanogenic corrinoid protein MtbC1
VSISEIREAIVELEDATAVALVEAAIKEGVEDPSDILKNGVMEGLKEIGARFAAGEYYLSELVLGGELTDRCIAILDPYLPKSVGPKRGVVVIGAVKGDVHSIGYGLVAKQLELAGYKVHSLGIDVPSMTFIDKAQEVHADIIGLSAFLVTTIPYCGELINYLKDMNIRDQYKVIIGGAETNQDVADAMGANGWSANATEAVLLCDRLMGLS